MKSYSDLYIKRRKEIHLDGIEDYAYEAYAIATDAIIKKYDREIKELQTHYDLLETKIEQKYREEGSYEGDVIGSLIGEQLACEEKLTHLKTYPELLLEMRVIYLYRSVELNIKQMVRIAYPKTLIKDLFRWDTVKSFFASRGIKLSDLKGYSELLELRKLNNTLKHSSDFGPGIYEIKEFSREAPVEYRQFQEFYNRIVPAIRTFILSLKEEIKKDLYVFSEARLEALVREYYEQMSEETYHRFILKLKSKEDL